MSGNLAEQLAEAEAAVKRLKQEINGATCVRAGHDWQLVGGKNCGCFQGNECCSIEVMECRRCGDSDYGDTPENKDRIERCYRNKCDCCGKILIDEPVAYPEDVGQLCQACNTSRFEVLAEEAQDPRP